MAARVALTLFLIAAASACGGEGPAPSPEPVPRRAVGMVVELDAEGDVVRGFVLQTEEGDLYEIRIDPEIDYGFDLEHLRQHLTQREPVEVALEQRGDAIYATSILDA